MEAEECWVKFIDFSPRYVKVMGWHNKIRHGSLRLDVINTC